MSTPDEMPEVEADSALPDVAIDDTPLVESASTRFARECAEGISDTAATKGFPWDDEEGAFPFRGISPEGLKALPKEFRALDWAEGKDEKWRLTPCETNAIGILRHDQRWRGVLALDIMAKRIAVTREPPWHTYEPRASASTFDIDLDPTRMTDWFRRAYGWTMTPKRLLDCAAVVADAKRFHPVKKWLRGLPKHDGVSRVHEFFMRYCGAEDSDYTRAMGRVFLVSLVARVEEPGVKCDDVVVLEGPQGLKKSTLLKRLVGAEWFAENTCDIAGKDAALALHGKWLIEMPELAGMTRSQVESIKAFFSRASDWLRPPYARGFLDYLRSSVCAATTNDKQYLRDRTGNRRFRPIKCTAIDIAGVDRDREQIFAEAFALYRALKSAGKPWWIEDAATKKLAEDVAEARETIDPWEQTLAAWASASPPHPHPAKAKREALPPLPPRGETGFLLTHALEDALGIAVDRQHPEIAGRVGKILERLGLQLTRPRNRAAEREALARGGKYARPRIYRWAQGPEASGAKP